MKKFNQARVNGGSNYDSLKGSTERNAILKLEIVSIKTTVGGHSPLKPLTVWDEFLGRSAERSK